MKTYALESELCEAFKPTGFQRGWTLHGERWRWDMVWVDSEGRRLGVQANLGDGPRAVAQCLEGLKRGEVHAAAILIPHANESLRRLCNAQGLGVLTPIRNVDEKGFQRFWVALPKSPDPGAASPMKPLPKHAREHSKCGTPHPRELTPIAEKELRLCALMRSLAPRRHGPDRDKLIATAAEVKSVGLDRVWWKPKWLRWTGGVYKRVIETPMPDEFREFAEVAAKYAEDVA